MGPANARVCSDCPDENDIVEFVEGALSEVDRAAIEAHCARCERCRESLDAAHPAAAPGAPCLLTREVASAVQGVASDVAAEAMVGRRIGRFEVIGVQGRGQFGVVYRARDTQLGRMVAVKVMRRGRSQDHAIREALFQTEAAAAARLSHPNIVTLHDHGEFEGGRYLILELLDGETLRSRLERERRLAPAAALAIAIDVTRALLEAHAAGVIHRDIKPGNVFLCTSGQTKVLDLGLAQLRDSDAGAGAWEGVSPAGTPRYMAPELFCGGAADERTDIYAAGVMLLDSLVGAPGGPRSIDERVATAGLPRRLRHLVRKATAPDRADRFVDARALLAALIRAQRRWVTRRGLALVAAVLATAAGVAYVQRSEPRVAKPAVAVLGFTDLSGQGNSAWLSTALTEMLDADLASSPAVRVVSPALVLRARRDLAVPEGELLEPGARGELRRYLGADYLVTGAYFSTGADGAARMRVDVRLQGANGLLLAVSDTGGTSELLDVMARIASRVRVRLAGAAITPDEARALRASMPSSSDAVRLYSEGLRRWRTGDLVEARDVLARAVAAEPGFPLAHAALSQVLHALGELDRERDEAKLAFERSDGLRREERWLVAAQYHEAFDEWPLASELRRNLHELFPDDLEYGLELADALDDHRQKNEALAVIAELRRLPPPQRDDPRIDLCEAQAQGDFRTRKALAISAADKARALGSRWLLARARVRESNAERELGELELSLVAAEEARAIYESLGDREGLSIALFNLATTRGRRGEPIPREIATYEQALELERQIGNQDQVALMLANLAYDDLAAGNPRQAAVRLDEIERLGRRKVKDHTDRPRAVQWLLQGEPRRAFALLDHVRQAFAGKTRGFELKQLGDVLIAEGKLDQARALLEQFLALDWPPDGNLYVTGLLSLARVLVEDGQAERAEARARDSIAICERTHDQLNLVTALAMLARVLVAERRFDEAKPVAEAALELAARIETLPEWIDAKIALARAIAGARAADVDLALATAGAALERARVRGLAGHAYEARLAAAEIAARGRGDSGPLFQLADEAEQHGLGLIARNARRAAARLR